MDSGVYEYTAGPWRDFFRSTRAHNTVEVAAADQSEVWGSFRVARRARPGAVIWESKKGYALVQGEHNGYARLAIPLIHRRTILWEKKGFWLVVDQLIGEGMCRCANRVHFHPSWPQPGKGCVERFPLLWKCGTFGLRFLWNWGFCVTST